MGKLVRKIVFFCINTIVITFFAYLGLAFISNSWNFLSFDRTLKLMIFLFWAFAMTGNTVYVLGQQKKIKSK